MNKKKAIRFIKLLIGLINSCMPKYSKRVLFKTVPDFSGNGKALSDYIVSSQDSFEVIWIVENINASQKGIKFVKKGTMQAFWFYFTSRYVVTTHNEMIGAKGKNQIYISLWHGMPLKKIGYLEPNECVNMEDYSALRISTSEVMRSVISACFKENANNVYITGQPRNDFIFNSKLTLEQLGITYKYKKVIFYAPTFRENQNDLSSSDGGNIVNNNFLRTPDFDLEKLNKSLVDEGAVLLLKLHPFEEKSLSDTALASNIKIITSQLLNDLNLDINHVLAITDILVSDYSSVYFDFLISNKPMVFLVPDKNAYRESRGGFVLEPFDFWTPGRKVITQTELIEEIINLVDGKDLYYDKRIVVNSIVNKYSDNKNCERVFNLFFK